MRRLVGVFLIATFSLGLLACSDDDAGDAADAALAYDNELFSWVCACFWAQEGFSGEDECRDYLLWDGEERSEVIQCSRDAMAEVEVQRPESVDEYFSCYTAALDNGRRCLRDIDHDEMCGGASQVDVESCDMEVYDDIDRCRDDIEDDDDAQEWFEEWHWELERLCPDF